MEQCRAAVAGPRELDLASHGGRREEEERGEAARRRGAGGTYRPESTWARGVASGGGWFGPGLLDGERAERAGSAAHGGAAWQLGRAFGTRVSVGWCQGADQVALEGFPGPLGRRRAVDEVHRWRTVGGGRNRAPGGERDGGEGLFVSSENQGTSR